MWRGRGWLLSWRVSGLRGWFGGLVGERWSASGGNWLLLLLPSDHHCSVLSHIHVPSGAGYGPHVHT